MTLRRCRSLVGLPWLSGLALLALLFFSSSQAPAQTVELNPVTISGVVRFPGLEIDRMNVVAQIGRTLVAVREFRPQAETAPYEITVQVPAGGTRVYTIALSGNHDAGVFQFIAGTVLVRDGEPLIADFEFDPPTTIEGTITSANGGLMTGATVLIREDVTFASNILTVVPQAPPGGSDRLDFKMPVPPGVRFRCQGGVRFENGTTAQIFAPTTITLGEGESARCDFIVDEPELPSGTLRGSVDLSGDQDVVQYRIQASRPGFGSFRQTLEAPFEGPANRAEFRLEDLDPGIYRLSATATLSDGSTFTLPKPDDPRFSVENGQETVAELSTCQASVFGRLEFEGTLANAEATPGVGLSGQPSQAASTFMGGGSTHVDRDTGDFDLLVSAGDWRSYSIGLGAQREYFVQPGFLDQAGSLQELRDPPTLACGERIERDFEYDTGRVEIRFRVADGRWLANPTLQGQGCRGIDASTGGPAYNYTFSARSRNTQTSTPVGRVPFEGPAAKCDSIQAFATVGGTGTLFGTLRDIEIIPDTSIVIEPEGPRIEISTPVPEARVDARQILVRGLASDDVAVTNVQVNGVEASLQSAGNPNDTAEVVYEATIPLVDGENLITAIATDEDGREGETSIGIVNESTGPEPRRCDANDDGWVDRTDIAAIFALRGSSASGPNDPLDINRDGMMSINDGRLCVLECDEPQCRPAL